MMSSKPDWVLVPPTLASKGEHAFDKYPDESIEQWHKKRKLDD